MFKILKEDGPNISAKAQGKIDISDYKEFLPIIEELMAKYDKINCVADVSDVESLTPEAFLEEIKLSFKYRNNIGRYALVGAKPWMDDLIQIIEALVKGEIKLFNKEDQEKAWQWIQEG